MITLLAHLALALRLLELQPALRDPLAHVHAAARAAGDDLPSELLLGIAFRESGYFPCAMTYLTTAGDERTRVGSIRCWKTPPGYGPFYCGLSGVWAPTWERCVALRSIDLSYQASAHWLRSWLRFAKGDIRRALAGYACGTDAAKAVRGCGTLPEERLATARRIGGGA